jgi:hypothetical protein
MNIQRPVVVVKTLLLWLAVVFQFACKPPHGPTLLWDQAGGTPVVYFNVWIHDDDGIRVEQVNYDAVCTAGRCRLLLKQRPRGALTVKLQACRSHESCSEWSTIASMAGQ